MNILDYIPKGKENAVTREALCIYTGLDDRTVRKLIELARDGGARGKICRSRTSPFQDDKKELRQWRSEECLRKRLLTATLFLICR